MGLTLGVLHEAVVAYHQISPSEPYRRQIAYCEMNPCIYFDIGPKNGLAFGRIVVELQSKAQPALVHHFLQLCIGRSNTPKAKPASYRGARITSIDLKNKTLLVGNVESGWATFIPEKLGGFEVIEERPSIAAFREGSVIMLPFSFDSNRFASLFYFHLGDSTEIQDGRVIGKIIDGHEVLSSLFSFSSSAPIGHPTTDIRILRSGRV